MDISPYIFLQVDSTLPLSVKTYLNNVQTKLHHTIAHNLQSAIQTALPTDEHYQMKFILEAKEWIVFIVDKERVVSHNSDYFQLSGTNILHFGFTDNYLTYMVFCNYTTHSCPSCFDSTVTDIFQNIFSNSELVHFFDLALLTAALIR